MPRYALDNVSEYDHPNVLKVWERSVRATHYFLSEDDILFYKSVIPDYLYKVRLTCVRNEYGEIIAFSGCNSYELGMLFVDPNYMRQGIGSLLLRHCIKHYQINKVSVNEQNPQAYNFYIKHGFKFTSKSASGGYGKPYPVLNLALLNSAIYEQGYFKKWS